MTLTGRVVPRVLTVLMLLAVVVAGGCGPSETADPSTVEPPVVLDRPGIYEAPGGQVRVVGIFDRVNLEGGFWAVLGVAPTDAAESQVVAVIANAEELGLDLPALRGRYVEVIGTQLEGASIRMAGPEVEARSITIIAEEEEETGPMELFD